MKTNITVSLCISNDFIVDVEEATPENLYDAFMVQYGLPLEVSNYAENGKWIVDDIEIINNG
jgi:hypothetical protein